MKEHDNLVAKENSNGKGSPKPKPSRNKEFNYNKILPRDILKILDEKIMGQKEAKSLLSVILCDHLKRSYGPKELENFIHKSNVFIVGPSGSGKTEFGRVISDKFKVPFIDYDTTRLSMVGYQGESVTDLFETLINKVEGNVALAERAIIYLDELDKKAESNQSGNISTTQAQSSLLKILEGTEITVKYKKEWKTIRTHKILFIGGGAFNDTDFFKTKNNKKVGFSGNGSSTNTIDSSSLPRMLSDLGMSNQLIGRFSTVVRTHKLNPLEKLEYLQRFQGSGVDLNKHRFFSYGVPSLEFSDCFLEKVIKESYNANTGIRGLNSLITNYASLVLGQLKDNTKKIKLLSNGFKMNSSKKILPYTREES